MVLIHSVEASCAFVWPVASALLLSHFVSVGRHGVGIHMLYAFITQPFMKVCFVDLGVIFLHVSIAWYLSELLRGGKSKQTNMKNKRLASLRDTLLHVSRTERSFFLPLNLCYSGLYRFCFSRSDGCGLLKASTHRPKNCSVTMGTGVNREFMKVRGFQFTTAKCVRTCETPSLSLYFQGEIPMHGNVIWVQFFGYGHVYSHEELRSSVSDFSSFSAWFS